MKIPTSYKYSNQSQQSSILNSYVMGAEIFVVRLNYCPTGFPADCRTKEKFSVNQALTKSSSTSIVELGDIKRS